MMPEPATPRQGAERVRMISLPVAAPTEWPQLRNRAWLPQLDQALVPTPGDAELLARLHAPGALVVTTGQQPGLFGGPLYTVHKALAAKALADRLSRDWGRPVVPLFWIAGDDHDHAEASVASWLSLDRRPVRWSLPPRPATEPQLPMSRELLPAQVEEGITELAAALPGGETADAAIAWLRRYYRPGATFHAAYREALAELLAPWGVLCIDPTSPVFKRQQIPLLEQALLQAATLDQALAELPDPGTGIRAGEGATLVFLETAVGRERLLLDRAGFRGRQSGELFAREELLELLHHQPERFSANVLLRPVVESALLPTVAYLAGPGEYRYLTAQARVLYPLLGVDRQVPMPRWGGAIVEPWVDRLLRRLGLGLDEVLLGTQQIERTLLRGQLSPEALQALDDLRSQLSLTRQQLLADSADADGVIRAIQGRSNRLGQLIDDLQRRYENGVRLREETAWHQYRRIRGALMPFDAPQERSLSVAGIWGLAGNAWLAEAASAAGQWAAALVDPSPSDR